MRVSAIIPTYNYTRYLRQAIESVIKQSVKPNEIIVMDDHSNDMPYDIVKDYEVTYVRNQRNLGAPANFNRGVSIANGDYVFLLGADNYIHPQYIEKLMKPLEKTEVGIAYSNVYLFGERALQHADGSMWWKGEIHNDKYFCWEMPKFDRESLFVENYINGSAMFKRECWKSVGGYKNMSRAEDWQLWKDIVSVGWKAELVPDYLLYYRQHSDNQRNSSQNPNKLNYKDEVKNRGS